MTNTVHPHRHRDSHKNQYRPLSSQAPSTAQATQSEALFVIDRKGDLQNLRYGSIDKYKVPRYRPVGYGRLLGLSRRFKVVSSTATERQINDEALDPSCKDRNFPLRLKSQSHEDSLLTLGEEPGSQDLFGDQEDYVRLGRKRRRVSGPDDRDENSPGQSLVTRGSRSSSLISKSDSDSSEDKLGSTQPVQPDLFEVFKNHPDNKKYLELMRHTESNPQDPDGWQNLIDHQERYFILSAGIDERSLTASQKRTVVDMRLSLYEKAISSVKNNASRERLILGMMKEGAKVWESDKQVKEWKNVLLDSTSIDLWYEFLNFQQTSVVAFTYEKCLDTYLSIFKRTLRLEDRDRDYHCTYLILRLTRFMHEAGFTERAIAIWQALLEYNVLRPSSPSDGIEDFEAFWENELPRIGEQGAKGWSSNTEVELPSQIDQPLPDLDNTLLLSAWSDSEITRSRTDIMPARTLDETVEDDPFRVILSSDIKEFLFRTATTQGQQLLLQGFLKFCGLPPILTSIRECRKWWLDPFLCNFHPDHEIGLLNDTHELFLPTNSSPYLWDCLSDIPSNVLDFTVRALDLLVDADATDDHLAEYTIALHLARDPKSTRKYAKYLLKQRSNSLLLYNAYAFVEVRNGKMVSANNVWSTALSMSMSLGPNAQGDVIVLWHSWIWSLIEAKQYTYAQNLLTTVLTSDVIMNQVLQAASNDVLSSAGQRLRADASFREHISDCLAQQDNRIVEHIDLFAMLKYLSGANSLENATAVYQSNLSLLNQNQFPIVIERLHQFRARFSHFHAASSRTGYRPLQILTILEQSSTTFPENSIFSSLREVYLRQAGMVDRVRLLKTENDEAKNTTVSLLRGISKEMSRPSYSGSTVHSIRHAFTNATAIDSPVRCCPALWLRWIDWESSLTVLQSSTAKSQLKHVYLAALRACPWCKDLYLRGFASSSLRDVLGRRELEQVYRSMSERGLRIRHDIVDVLDDAE